MSSKTTPTLDDLRAQARRTFRTWPLYLMLRLRAVEQHLTPAQRADLGPILGDASDPVTPLPASTAHDGRLTLLWEYGLLPEDVAFPEPLPQLSERPQIATCQFHARTDAEGVRLSCEALSDSEAETLCLDLLRTEAVYGDEVKVAAAVFTRMQAEVSSDAALEAARLWAALHGSRALAWTTVTHEGSSTVSPSPALPPRRRGRGQFRSPN